MKAVVNMACGLANRMFQYSYYLYLRQLGYDAYTDYYTRAKLPHEEVDWNGIFPDAALRPAPSDLVRRLGGGSGIAGRIRRRLPVFNRVMQMSSAFDVELPDRNGADRYVMGVFQNAEMVGCIGVEALRSFVFSPLRGERNLRLAGEIASCESVAVHVRKGKDYSSRIWYEGTCGTDYYSSAFGVMRRLAPGCRYFVFTDNPEWVRMNFTGFEYTLVDWNPGAGQGSHLDMQLMSLCRHNIISNSTYSWWAAWLNRNKDKKVIVPDRWFNPQSCSEWRSERLICPEWLAI